MATEIQLRRSGSYETISVYQDFAIDVGVSDVLVAPEASFVTNANVSVDANQDARIVIDGTTRFEGVTKSAGTIRGDGQRDVELEHPAAALWAETVSITETGPPTDEAVLNAALTAAERGGDFTLSYSGTATTLDSDYEVEDRSVKAIFRDMTDRTNRIWWVTPAGTTINVAPKGDRGTWNSLTAQDDGVSVRDFDEGNVRTVRNHVTVVATGAEQQRATVTDSGSISTYGKRTGNSPYNIAYASTQAEAQSVASSLLVSTPQAEATVAVPQSAGTIEAPLANYEIDLTDDSKNISATGLLIERQTIQQDRIILETGKGKGVSLADRNRRAKSDRDVTEPGSVYNSDRLADDSVDSDQLVDASVIEQKIDDAAVATAKLQANAVVNGKLDDLSVSETKIQDDSIATPKLKASAVTAAKILADTITANEIAAGTITATEILADTITAAQIAGDTITASEIAADTLTANEIDTLDLDTGELSVTTTNGDASLEFQTETNQILGDLLKITPTGSNPIAFLGGDGANFSSVWTEDVFTSSGGSGQIGSSNNPYGAMYTNQILAEGSDSTFTGNGASNSVEFQGVGTYTEVVPGVDNRCRVGNSTDSFDEMWSYDYFDASTGTALSDGGDPLAGLAEGHGPPDHAQLEREVEREDGTTETKTGTSLSTLAHSLMDICREQQRRMEDMEDRISALEQRLSDSGGN
jgi:hypothetical protein